MSNPVTDAQVEDVLSSIRRLVSSDVRPDGRDVEDMEQPSIESPKAGVDRLVLSPALRVAATQSELSEDTDELTDLAPDDAETTTQAVSDNEPPAEDRPSEDDDVAPVSEDGEDQVAVMATEDEDTEPEPDSLSSDMDSEALRFLFRARKRPTVEAVPDADDMAATELADTEAAQAPEIDASDAAEKRSPFLLTNPQPSAEQDEDGAGDDDPEKMAASDDSDALRAPENAGDAVSPDELTAKIAAVESVIAQTSDQWEPDDDGADDYAGTAVESLEWEDHHDLDAPDEERDQARPTTVSTEAPIEIEAELVEAVEELQDDLAEAGLEAALEAEFIEPEETMEQEPVSVDLEVEEVRPAAVAEVLADEVVSAEIVGEDFEAASEAEIGELEDSAEDERSSADSETEVVELAEVTDDEVPDVDAVQESAADLQSDLDDADPDVSDIDEDAVLDEEALRELVNEIVHQELNGKLGERITHNVRKLVRRELQRALASQDLS